MMNNAVIALGSNIDPEYHTPAAIDALSEQFTLIGQSEFVYTEPLGYKDQADFLNGAVLIKTSSRAEEITSTLKKIEQELGRERTENKNGPRTMDLDLVLLNGTIVDDDVYERNFLQDAITELLPQFSLSEFEK